MDARHREGNEGEKLAAQYLVEKGLRVVAWQWRTLIGEVDLIAKHGDELVFVEVKTRRGSSFGFPEEAVGAAKYQKLRALAETYCAQAGWRGRFRIDVVAVELGGAKPKISHFVGV